MHDPSTCPGGGAGDAGGATGGATGEGAMTDAAFAAFVAACREELRTKQERFVGELVGVARWTYDLAAPTLTFDGAPARRVTPIGTYCRADGTWMWAWANEGLPEPARRAAAGLRDLRRTTGFAVFEMAGLGATLAEAEDLVAIAIHHLGAVGLFRVPADDADDAELFLAVQAVPASQPSG